MDFPTLGDLIDGWVRQHCRVPDGFARRQPFDMSDWQFWCTANHYRVRENAKWVPAKPLLNQAFVYRRSLIVSAQKALALDTPIPTPSGWTTMADVLPGDDVFDRFGRPTVVLSKSPVWRVPSYRVRFSDGESLVACGDHDWVVDRRTTGSRYVEERRSTESMLGQLVDRFGARRFRVRNTRPFDLPERSLPVDPYVLGAWLGDGNSDDGRLTGLDREIFDRVAATGYEVRQMAAVKRVNVIGLKAQLRALGVLCNKHIPAEYLRASTEQRWALLQGLMDTDGHADRRQGKCEFTTVLPALADGVMELLRSLGVRPVVYEGVARLNGRATGPKWRISFAARADMPVFHLERKQSRLRPPGTSHAQFEHRRIVAIEPVEPVPTQCLTVASSTHTFLAGSGMIPTGNTGKGPWTATIAAVEGVGPALFAGWAKKGEAYVCAEHGCPCGWYFDYQPGEPKGMRHPSPLIQLTATSADQVDNIYNPLRSMIAMGPLRELMKVRENFVRILGLNEDPDLDRIDVVTASANSRLGNPISFAIQDETGTYTTANQMRKVAETQRRGAAGMGGRTIETTNCWDPAEDSVAQRTFESAAQDVFRFYRNPDLALKGKDGKPLSYRVKAQRARIHRYVYDGSPWVNLASIEAEAVELMEKDPAQAERFFGNRVVKGAGTWLPDGLWDGAYAGQ